MRNSINTFVNQTQTRKRLAITALAVVASAVALTVSGRVQAVVGGPTCNVPADYATIQLAVDAAGCSTIKVAAGDYPESVTIPRSLTLKGAKAGVNVNSRTFDSASESTVDGATAGAATFTVSAADVTIDGFSVTNPGEGVGIDVKTAGNNAVIKNNIVDGVGGPTFLNHTVGVYLELGPDNVKVASNKITHIQSATAGAPGTAQGILVGDSTSADPSLGVRIDNNTITDVTSAARGAYGIQLNNGSSAAPAATGYTTAKISGNTIKNLNGAGWVHAIGLEGDTPNVVVKNNTISNLISTTADRIAVFFEDNVFFFTGAVNQNSLDVSSTAYGIAVHPALTTLYSTLSVDGTCNWWGARSGPGPVGPGTGSLVSLGVDFKPWLRSANSNGHGQCGDKDRDYNDHHSGHGNDDKNRWGDWDD